MRKTVKSPVRRCRFTRLFMFIAALMLVVSSGYLNTSAALAQDQPKVFDSMQPNRRTTEGVVIGELHKATNTFSWKGIPYARPPVGRLRWEPPPDATETFGAFEGL